MEIILVVALGAMLIFFMFNSRKKQKARAEQISNNLVPGARVMTNFGLFGTVTDIDDDGIKVTIESGPGTTMVVHRQAIGQIEPPESAVTEPGTVAEPGVADAAETSPAVEETADDGRITDAELDAMNAERARRGDDAADDTAGSADSDAADGDVVEIDEVDIEETDTNPGNSGEQSGDKRPGSGPEAGTV